MVQIEQLIGLNDEIAAILRGKLPLAGDISFLTRNPESRLSQLGNLLASKLGRGESLSSAIKNADPQIPDQYRHIIEIGLKADHLPVAIESMATQGRALATAGERFRFALVYPVFVCGLAYVLVMFVLLNLSRQLQESADAMQLEQSHLLQWIALARDSAPLWSWLPPLVVIFVWFWWRASDRRNNALGQPAQLIRRLPSGRRTAKLSQSASLAELIAALLERGVAVDEALVLAANAIGDAPMRSAARQLAESMRQTDVGVDPPSAADGIAPLTRWILLSHADPASAARSLRVVASNYRCQAAELTEKAGLLYPIMATVVVAGTVTCAYALLTMVPLIQFITQLSMPHTR